MKYKLSDLFDLQMGKTPARCNPVYWIDGTHRWISISDMSSFGKYTAQTKEQISDTAVAEAGMKLIPSNTVIMSFKLSIGKVAITSEPVYSNEAIMAFIDKGVVDILPEFLYYQLSSIDFSSQTRRAVMGSTLNKKSLSELAILVPSIGQQRTTVQTLNSVSEAIQNYETTLQKLDELVKSRFIEMFGTISQAQVCWGTRPLKSVVSLLGGYAFKSSEYSTRGTRIIRISNVQNGYIEDKAPVYYSDSDMSGLERYLLRRGDLLMSLTGNVGRVGFLQKELLPAALNQRVVCLREACGCSNNRQVHMRYLYELFRSSDFQRIAESNSSGVAQKNLSTKWLAAFNVPLPPFTLQEEFAALAYRVDKLRFDCEWASALLSKR